VERVYKREEGRVDEDIITREGSKVNREIRGEREVDMITRKRIYELVKGKVTQRTRRLAGLLVKNSIEYEKAYQKLLKGQDSNENELYLKDTMLRKALGIYLYKPRRME